MNTTAKELQLLTPGPVPVPDFVMEAISQAVMPHRTTAFEAFYSHMLERLKYLFLTEQHVCTMMGSGTYGVESAMYSLFQPADEVLVVEMGKFSERWADYGELLRLKISRLTKEWGQSPSVDEIVEAGKACMDLRGVILTHSETSTGAMIDLEEIALAVREDFPDALILVDAITSVGSMPFYMDDWDIDCTVVASQKALMNPAGLVAFAISERASNRMQAHHKADFRHLGNYLSWAARHNYPFTPPVQLLYGIDAALQYIESETLPVMWNRSHQSAQTFRRGLKKLGGRLFADMPSESLSAFSFPDQDMIALKKQLEVDHGIQISGGQGELKGKIGRISHMGMADAEVMEKVLMNIHKFI